MRQSSAVRGQCSGGAGGRNPDLVAAAGRVRGRRVSGELDILTSRRFDECLAEARRDDVHIIIDLGAVDFMDTGSLAVIVGHWKQVTAAGGTLALAGARYRYTKTLWITGLADRLPMYDSVDAAIAAGAAGTGGAPAASQS